MKTIFKFCVTLFTLALILSTESCTKDPLYDVNNDIIHRDTTIIQSDTTIINADTHIASMAIISDDYSVGMPTFTSNNRVYSYSGTSSDGSVTKENIFVSSWDQFTVINVRLNPSNISLDGVEWSIIKRAAKTPTKLIDGDIAFTGEFEVERSDKYPAKLTFRVKSNEDNFFVSDGYVYAVVATYSNGQEVVSDIACYLEAADLNTKIESVFLGVEEDGVIIDYNNYRKKLSKNREIVAEPQPYAVFGGETKKFSDIGIDSDDYKVELIDYTTVENTLPKEDATSDDATTKLWAVGPEVGGIYSDYNYNEFIGEGKFTYSLSTADKNFVANKSIMTVYTEMDDVNITTNVSKDINDNVILVGSKFTVEGYDMSDFIFRVYGNEGVDFRSDYTNVKYYIGNNEVSSSDVRANWIYGADGNIKYTVSVNKELSKEDETIKVVVKPALSESTLPTFTHNINLSLDDKHAITYPTAKSSYETWGNFVGDNYQLTFALSEIFKNNQDLTDKDSIDGYTYKLSFGATNNNGVFIKDGVAYSTLEGNFSEIESVLKDTQLALGSMLTSDAAKVTAKLETYYKGVSDKEVKTDVIFNNPIFVLVDNYGIKAAEGSTCSLKDGLNVSIKAGVTGSEVIIFEDGDFVNTDPKFSPSDISYERGSLNAKVSLSDAGVITATESLSGLTDIGNAGITISVGSAEFGVKKSISPKVSVVL